MEKQKIKLGDRVRCKITGFEGVVVAKSEFINGCIQMDVLPKTKKKDKMPEASGIDIQSLELIKPIKKIMKIMKRNTGGANNKQINLRGY